MKKKNTKNNNDKVRHRMEMWETESGEWQWECEIKTTQSIEEMRCRGEWETTTFVSYRFLHAASITTSLTFKTKKIFRSLSLLKIRLVFAALTIITPNKLCERLFVCVCVRQRENAKIFFWLPVNIYTEYFLVFSRYFLNSCVSNQNGFMFWGFVWVCACV